MTPLISADNSVALWALMAVGTAVSLWLEARYRWADKLSAPVIALLLAMALSNTGVMPTDAPAYDFVGTWLVPLALPLLLLQANLVRIARETGKLFLAVHLSTLGTVVGAFLAVGLLRNAGIEELDKAAAIMTGSYVGGMVNFLAIQDSVQASGTLVSALIVADNIIMAGFFLILLWMAGSRFFQKHYPHPHIDAATAAAHAPAPETDVPLTVTQLAAAIGYASAVVALALGVGKFNLGLFPAEVKAGSWLQFLQVLASNRFVLITALSLGVATLCHRWLTPLFGTEKIGAYLLFLFLFSIGLPADLRLVVTQAPLLFVLCGVMAVMNLAGTMVLGKLLKLELEPLLISSNATLGGPPTAAAMAVSRGWSRLVLPGLLAGLWGYIIGTPVGLMVYTMLGGGK